MDRFDIMCDNISGITPAGERFGECDENGVSAWYCEEDYCRLVDTERQTDMIEFDVDGVTYYEHWFFVNEQHESSVVGYSLLSDDGDVKFCVIGCKTDFVCDFSTMYEYLTDSTYFVD